MTEQSLSIDDIDSIERCFDAYGASLDKWPQDAQARYGVLAMSPHFDDVRNAAAQVDAALSAATLPLMNEQLDATLLADFMAQKTQSTIHAGPAHAFSDFKLWLFGKSRALPGAAFAALAALGFFSGAMTTTASAIAPETEAYAYAYADDLFSLSDINEDVQ